jgi:enediyne biosynthesis protein E4
VKPLWLLALLLAAAGPPPWRMQMLPVQLSSGESSKKYLPATMPGGLAVFDFDGDGLLDLFFSNGGDLPEGVKGQPLHANRLLRNLGGLRFADVTARSGLAGRDYNFGAAAADYDGDGRPDLLVTGLRGVTLWRNRGDGTFANATSQAGLDNQGRWAVAGVWFDKDNDGDLDLFIANYVEWSAALERECLVRGKVDFCHPRYYAPSPNALFENRGDGKFVDVSETAGIGAHKGKGMSAVAADFDGNGFTDIFVTNDRVFNFLFLNRDGKRFEESAFAWNAAAPRDGNPVSGMGVDAQDLDNDGRPDLVYTALRDETFPLLRNTGSAFEEITAASNLAVLTRPMAGWGVAMADLDNDGWKDIAAARSDALSATGGRGAAAKEPPSWFRNLGNGKFKLGDGWGHLPKEMYRGIAAADLDNDGCLDIVLTALEAQARILRNPCPTGRWLKVDAMGARVRVDRQWREAGTAVGYASSYLGPAHFGLGSAREASEVEAIWPGGRRKLLRNVAANQTLKVEP